MPTEIYEWLKARTRCSIDLCGFTIADFTGKTQSMIGAKDSRCKVEVHKNIDEIDKIEKIPHIELEAIERTRATIAVVQSL